MNSRKIWKYNEMREFEVEFRAGMETLEL